MQPALREGQAPLRESLAPFHKKRLFNDLKKLEYNERLQKLKLWTLKERRSRADRLDWTVQDGMKHLRSATGLVLSICWINPYSRSPLQTGKNTQ